jgi:translation initiation factor 2B subunit (eIF-2B alpha/beta/delta family)
METPAGRVPVVTAFAHRGDKVALIRRSECVGTYKGAWAGFSGYIERLPLNQARLELEEEAGVAPEDARLTGIGIPLPIDDAQAGHKWLVFPFLFRLADEVEIKTDWEAEEWRWFAPEEVGGLDTVPGLKRALDRVWPPFGDSEFWDGLAAVATDTTHGATELARRGLAALGGYVQDVGKKLDRLELLRAIRAFAATRPAMGVFPDLAARLMLGMEREGGQFDFDELVTELLGVVEDSTDLSADEAAAGLRGKRKLFTLSYSEAVRDAILRWHTDESRVIVAESCPACEGKALAEYLSRHRVCVDVIPDSETASAIQEVDAILVGCDAITDSDEALNKAGTFPSVAAANEAGVPAYAVAQVFKIVPPGWPVFLELQSPGDLDPSADMKLTGSPRFDLTPLSRFEGIFTEEGLLTQERLSQIRSDLASVELIPRT